MLKVALIFSLSASMSVSSLTVSAQHQTSKAKVSAAAIIPFILDSGEAAPTSFSADYIRNLKMIRAASVRNRNHDNSQYRLVPSDKLVKENHFGPRSDYLNNPGGSPEQAFPTPQGGQNRTACEFSHFAYDDPLVFPNKPGASHLHMFFGNTDVNAYSSYETLINSGGGTCNGQELNRTGYWVPAMFDGDGNVRIPDRIVVYYKGEGLANGNSIAYPPGAAMIAKPNFNEVSTFTGGAEGKFSFACSNQYSENGGTSSNTIPTCDGDQYQDPDPTYTVLEVNVKFQQCWNRQDAGNIENWSIPEVGSWYNSDCREKATLPNLEYFVNYKVERGETTEDWFLSSDVNMQTLEIDKTPGSTIHGDWWGGWNKEINQTWIDNCVNFSVEGEISGCGFGYLTNGGPDNQNPEPGPALKIRPQFEGGIKVSAEQLLDELCDTDRTFGEDADAALCNPMMMPE